MASQAVSKSSDTQVASDHEASVKAFAEELKAMAEPTQNRFRVLQDTSVPLFLR